MHGVSKAQNAPRRPYGRRISKALVAIAITSTIALAAPAPALATGEAECLPSANSFAGQWVSVVGAWDRGARATIEGQSLPRCTFGGYYHPSGSFHWASVAYHDWSNGNIVQVGYGRCSWVNNELGFGTLCNGSYYYYWAWGAYCGSGDVKGSGGELGPIALRIGPSLSAPPST